MNTAQNWVLKTLENLPYCTEKDSSDQGFQINKPPNHQRSTKNPFAVLNKRKLQKMQTTASTQVNTSPIHLSPLVTCISSCRNGHNFSCCQHSLICMTSVLQEKSLCTTMSDSMKYSDCISATAKQG